MTPLLIDENVKTDIKNLVAYAEKNPFTMDDLLDIKNKAMKVAGDMGPYTIHIPVGYKVVYSIEQQVMGDVRHLSVSVFDQELPSVLAVVEIMKLIGFTDELLECIVKMEPIGENQKAVNIWEIIKGTEK